MDFYIKEMDVLNTDEIKGKARVHCSCWHDSYKDIIPSDQLKKITIDYCEKMAVKYPDNTYLAIEKDGDEVIGFLNIGYNSSNDVNIGEIFAIYVLPNYQGCRVGCSLMNHALSLLKDKEAVVLWTFKDNKKARKFYKDFGFEAKAEKLFRKDMDIKILKYIKYLK